MPKRKLIDNKALLKAIKDGVTKPEIMKQFGFNNGTQLQNAYNRAAIAEGLLPEIKGIGRTKKVKPVDTKVSVNSRGSLIIPKALIEDMKIKAGETFEAKKSTKGISLTKVQPAAKAEAK
mgnify:FL=1|jgi:hypothetical protein